MNNACLVGRLTKDPELRKTTNDTPVAAFTLAVNRRFKSENQEADFIGIVAWQKTAEFVDKYFRKGQQVWVQGRIQTRNWDDTEGKRHYVTEIVAEAVGFANSKKDNGGPQQQRPPQREYGEPPSQWREGAAAPPPPQQQQQQQQQQQETGFYGQPPARQQGYEKMPWE